MRFKTQSFEERVNQALAELALTSLGKTLWEIREAEGIPILIGDARMQEEARTIISFRPSSGEPVSHPIVVNPNIDPAHDDGQLKAALAHELGHVKQHRIDKTINEYLDLAPGDDKRIDLAQREFTVRYLTSGSFVMLADIIVLRVQ